MPPVPTRFKVWDTVPVNLEPGMPVTRDGLTPPIRMGSSQFSSRSYMRFTTVKERMKRLALSGGRERSDPGGTPRGPRRNIGNSVQDHCHLEGCSSKDITLVDTAHSTIDCNGFLQALDIAYNFHQGLHLRPDDIWLLITMGFSMHINADPEQYRHLLVNFEGQQTLLIRNDAVVPGKGLENDWIAAGVFSQFSEEIKNHIGEDLHKTLVAQFSTTTPQDRAISEIVLMDTTKAYFNYVAFGMCGIPEVVLEGTAEDWMKLRDRIEQFSEFGLDWWLEDLRYVLDEFVAAKSGNPDVNFWKRMYRGDHMEERYHQAGVTYVSGWIHVFFPYLMDKTYNMVRKEARKAQWRRSNPEAAYTIEPGMTCAQCGVDGGEMEGSEVRGSWWCRKCWRAHDIQRWYLHRVEHFEMPTGFRSVPFKWTYGVGGENTYDCKFYGGFAGCAINATSHAVRPQVAYCVANKGLEDQNGAERWSNGRTA